MGEVSHSGSGSFVNRVASDILAAQKNLSLVGLEQPDHHGKRGGLSGPVGPQQPDHLTLRHVERNTLDNATALKTLYELSNLNFHLMI